jgi:RimJ/RimL family protein N-acetyltransferase
VNTPFLVGRTIYLRPLEPADLAGAYSEWLNDREVTRYLETGIFPTTRDALQRYYQNVVLSRDNVALAIVLRDDDRHVGNIKLGPINWVHRRADMGVLIGDRGCWGRGIGTEAVRLITQYAFDRLNLHKVTLGVYAGHEPALRLYQSLGFEIEGTLKEHLFSDGRYHDKIVMGVRRAAFDRRG